MGKEILIKDEEPSKYASVLFILKIRFKLSLSLVLLGLIMIWGNCC